MRDKARQFAIQAHGDQRYGNRPYAFHLDAVATHAAPYGEVAQVVAYLHDVVEDTDIEVADIEAVFGPFVARCVALLTDEPGADRAERKRRTNAKLAGVGPDHQLALVVKTADRLANVTACIRDGHTRKLAMYAGEHRAFREAVFRDRLCDGLWDALGAAFAPAQKGSDTDPSSTDAAR